MKASKRDQSLRSPLEVTESIEKRAFELFRFIGYALLILSLFDYIAIILPPRLTDTNWEFQATGLIVDHIWALLLGLAFVFFYGQASVIINNRQLSILKFLSWASLVFGVFYLILVPLEINNGLTIYRGINNQFTTQQSQQQVQLQKIKEKVNLSKSNEELNKLAKALKVEKESDSNQSSQDLKTKISQQIETVANNSVNIANANKNQQVNNLIKESLRIGLGALISGVCLIGLWNITRWTRIS
jgi:predicted PurR-regulated permease PerM